MKPIASIDPCNRVWIEDEEYGRYVDDGGFYISFPQYESKREAKTPSPRRSPRRWPLRRRPLAS